MPYRQAVLDRNLGLEGRRRSELTATATATDELKLTPPEPLPPITPEKAAGLVPLSTDQKSKLEERVDGFIDDLIAQDENSPEFGKKVDQLTNMGRKEIMAAAGMSNRFLDRPVRAMDKDEGSAKIVKSVVNLGRDLALEVVAEGIENASLAQLLLDDGCHYGQGFGYAPALPAQEAEVYLNESLADGAAPIKARSG